MSVGYAVLFSTVICALAAAVEGASAGRNVKAFFSTLRFPSYSAPFWAWTIIGGLYYLIFWFVTYRLLRLGSSSLKSATLTLVVLMMIVNGLSNYVIFRARNLYLSFLIGCFFPIMDIALLICLTQLDRVAASWLVPYLIYRVYGVIWGFGLWRLNRNVQQ
jgi:tryptophan-rich sensory protein